MRRILLTFALSTAILAAGALVPDRAVINPFGAASPQQAIEFVRLA
ncbi:MAG: hypothetical protein WD207_04300 [Xanthobacteraceae bacterium]